ncbi:hypothetical protein [Anaerocolumna jejuensis]|uniref:hypothetical protein n=1 Tax=Anaerocolumna jejuensis TaxID=259063 RepID=UPI00147CEAB3|nr:hypothetical protein [Anaerocolumna jejuensis]
MLSRQAVPAAVTVGRTAGVPALVHGDPVVVPGGLGLAHGDLDLVPGVLVLVPGAMDLVHGVLADLPENLVHGVPAHGGVNHIFCKSAFLNETSKNVCI